MPRKFFKRYMPSADKVREVKAFRLFGERIFHPALWHLNRRTAAGGVAIGLFCGLIPGPFQMLGAGIAALLLRMNLPIALLTTLYTNPLTIVPLYLIAYQLGSFVLGATRGAQPQPPPDWVWTQPAASAEAFGRWMLSLGAPLALGVVLLASLLSACGYVIVRLIWNVHLRHAWHARRKRRAGSRA